MSDDYRDPQPIGNITWALPEGFHLASVSMRLHKNLPAYEVYITYEQMEPIEDRDCRIASGMTGYGETFHDAAKMAFDKVQVSLEKQREERKQFIRNPPPQPTLGRATAGKGTEINLDLSILDGLELKL